MGNYVRRAYHAQRPAWRNSQNLRGKYVGIEFECVSATDSYRDVLRALPDFKFGRSPVAEEDGSLPPSRGVELIFPPVSYKQFKNSKSVFAKAMKALEGKISTRATSPGMHININTNGWSNIKRQLFCATVHNIPNASLVRLGGRNLNSYCRQYLGSSIIYYANAYHSVASAKTGRIELRFPKPTTDHEKIKKIIEFAEVVEKFAEKAVYTKYTNSTDAIYDDFVKYASKTKKGKKVLAVLEETNEKTKKTISKDSDSSALPAQPVGYSIAPILRNTGEVFTLRPSAEAVSLRDQLGELSPSDSCSISEAA